MWKMEENLDLKWFKLVKGYNYRTRVSFLELKWMIYQFENLIEECKNKKYGNRWGWIYVLEDKMQSRENFKNGKYGWGNQERLVQETQFEPAADPEGKKKLGEVVTREIIEEKFHNICPCILWIFQTFRSFFRIWKDLLG